ncbi:HAD hydrolase-like protein [Paenibacillus oleatilyticus]|uniref:HAD hydrolase-like protein n=1 Tax=Paenibacillus oleatilyticus TaxID=2594886 RepID=UPI001C1F3816|nr:HAD hydrolase-like protein [Paenibacillus oleatilyticus]MBU7319747.1 HAD hydrolase-like protein [Paenibacillus oleatilyticus]
MSLGTVRVSDFNQLEKNIVYSMKEKDVIGFDIFDTIIRRRLEPEVIKDLVAKYAVDLIYKETKEKLDWQLIRKKRFDLEVTLGTRNEALGFDHEFLYENFLSEWIDSFNVSLDKKVLFDMLYEKEIQLEMSSQSLTPNIKKVLKRLLDENKKIIFISDMYFSIDIIWRFLDKLGVSRYFHKGFCSSQTLTKKMTGKLFEFVMKTESIQPNKMLFVGDNIYSDAKMASSKGIDVIHISDKLEKKRRTGLNLHHWASNRNDFWKGKYLEYVVKNISEHIKENQNPNYKLGLLVSPILILFVLYIMEQSQKNRLNRIVFLAREGKVFYDIYNKIITTFNLENEYPPASYLYVSRKSTFLPSMKEFSWKEIERFMVQYNKQSINSLLSNLSLPNEIYHKYALEVGLEDFDEIIENPSENEKFLNFINHDEVRALFIKHRDEAKNNFKKYIKQEGIWGLDKVAFVDIGWKGTIQDNITRTFEDDDEFPYVYGYYVGLINGHNDWGKKSDKFGFFADSRENNHINNVIFKNGSIFEMCTTPNHGTTIGYYNENGKIHPKLKSFEIEKENFNKYFADVFEAIDDYLQDFLIVYPLLQDETEQLKIYFIDQIRRYILYPSKQEVKSFFEYSHVESFGVFEVTTFNFKGNLLKEFFRKPLNKAPYRIKEIIRKQMWPEAVLRNLKIPFLNFLADFNSTRKQ